MDCNNTCIKHQELYSTGSVNLCCSGTVCFFPQMLNFKEILVLYSGIYIDTDFNGDLISSAVTDFYCKRIKLK
jgi:hypothetical protein